MPSYTHVEEVPNTGAEITIGNENPPMTPSHSGSDSDEDLQDSDLEEFEDFEVSIARLSMEEAQCGHNCFECSNYSFPIFCPIDEGE